ncbi:hypothetical protein RASY3_06695 [Ruminococcus albus SY3]|uniref:DUF4367 domain-containing protein n=1 Tax=Ruminococcus albus SY3 TaxID=1341156 RepID=A0A011VXZ2_RUMAL|nr:hypothetical protein [Ruminococcus albus]EXM40146.1 hypothetical protein RASY3_06695 [Ruminococcus albus SY3]
MKKMTAIIMALVMAAGVTACGNVNEVSSKVGAKIENTADVQTTDEQTEETQGDEGAEMCGIDGGWVIPDEIAIDKNPEARAALEKARETLAGAEFAPVAVLGTQAVAGTNYCILCKVTAVWVEQPTYVLVYVYEDLEGNAEITDTMEITLGNPETGYDETGVENIDGGWVIPDEIAIDKHPEASAALEKARETLVGAEFAPVAVLGTQAVAGTNYCILCKVTAVWVELPTYVLVYVYEDPEGNAEITDTMEITLGDADEENGETGEETVQMPDPWVEYSSAEEAGREAGLAFSVPEKLRENSIYLIQSFDGLAEVRYGSEDDEISYRKGRGADDISGDHNDYKEKAAMQIDDMIIYLRGNGDKMFGAVWNDDEYSYSYYAANGVSLETMQEDITALINENTK